MPNDWEVGWTVMAAMDGDGSNGTTSVSAAAGNLE